MCYQPMWNLFRKYPLKNEILGWSCSVQWFPHQNMSWGYSGLATSFLSFLILHQRTNLSFLVGLVRTCCIGRLDKKIMLNGHWPCYQILTYLIIGFSCIQLPLCQTRHWNTNTIRFCVIVCLIYLCDWHLTNRTLISCIYTVKHVFILQEVSL